MELTGKQRRFLRALAHPLNPVVQIGKSGLTDAVGSKLDEVLEVHELIKVKLLRECPLDLDAVSEAIERTARAAVAQVIGRTLVVYRARAKKPRIDLEHLRVRADTPAKPPAAGLNRTRR
jgi:RNA-binding protein